MSPARSPDARPYRGRIAPTPTGLLHLGHASTFAWAAERARLGGRPAVDDATPGTRPVKPGILVYRDEDIDPQRCKPEYARAALNDLRWLGLTWQEGPDVGGPFGPYRQSERMQHYRVAWEQLKAGGWIYPCSRSRKDLQHAPTAPHAGDDAAEALYPSAWRPPREAASAFSRPGEGDVNWRFAVPEGESIRFHDGRLGPQEFTAGVDFGDFVIWRRDDVPAYELAVVVDDAAMEISEVVRGEDLLKSTARQLLLYRALGLQPPGFFHAPLVKDPKTGERLAKRQAALSLRAKREAGALPGEILGERVGR